MKSVNKCIFIGNVGKEPETKYSPSGVAVSKFSLACNEKFKDKAGNWTERTEWINCIAFQKTAEVIKEYVAKGSRLYVEGRLQTSSWDDKQTGQKKYRTEIVIEELIMLGEKGEGNKAKPFESDKTGTHENAVDDEDSIPF